MMSNKHVIFLIPSLAGGGAERVVQRLAEGLLSQGVRVTIILLHSDISYSLPESVNLHVLSTQKKKGLSKLTYFWRASRELQYVVDAIQQKDPVDLVISNLPEMDQVVRFLRMKNVFFCIHNSLYQGKISQSKGLKKFIKAVKFKKLYHGKNLILVSSGVKQDLLEHLKITPAKAEVIYNPFPIQKIRELALVEVGSDMGSYFIHVGRFNNQKRHDRLLRLFAQSGVDDKLLLLGEGSERQKAKVIELIRQNKLDENVVMLDFQKNPYPYMKRAKALLLTSDYEGLGNVLIEALLCGTPVISFDCPSGPSEILGSDFPESLIPMGDDECFVDRLRELSLNPERVEVSSAFLERFDEKEVIKKYMALI